MTIITKSYIRRSHRSLKAKQSVKTCAQTYSFEKSNVQPQSGKMNLYIGLRKNEVILSFEDSESSITRALGIRCLTSQKHPDNLNN